MKVIFDLFTNQIKGINRECLPSEQYIYLPYPIKLSKTVEERTGNIIQKVDEEGRPLYKMPDSYDDFGDPIEGVEIYLETTESREVTEWREVSNQYRVATEETTTEIKINEEGEEVPIEVPVYETVTHTSLEPVEWIDYEPVMVPEVVNKTYSLEENPFLFTFQEVIEAKQKSINEARNANLMFFTCFDEKMEFLDLSNCSRADLGNGFVSIQEGGYIQTNLIDLGVTTKLLEIYSEKQTKDSFSILVSADNGPFMPIDQYNQMLYTEDVSKVRVKFVNTNSSRRELYAYGILV